MTGAPQEIEAKVRTLAGEALSRSGYELVDLDYRREPAGWILRLYIDRPGGVTLEDCQRVSHEVGTILEVEDPIPHHYTLEVSSPGLDRPLRKPGDFLAATGKPVRIVAREPINGRRNFTGRLAQVEPEGTLRLVDETGAEYVIPGEIVERARLVYEWPAAAAKRAARGSGRR